MIGILAPIWHEKPPTARKLRQRIRAVLEWAVAMEYRTDNPCDRVLRSSDAVPVAVLDFEFLVLTATRWGEVRCAEWSEVDQTQGMWTVPGTRMKSKRDHRVPLCRRAKEILDEARTLDDGAARLVFTREGGKPLADRQLRHLLHRNQIAAVPHGFRSAFRAWAAEETDHPREVVEAAPAHGRLGGLSGWRESPAGVRPAPLIRRGRPPGRLRNLAFAPASGRSILTAEKWGSVPIGECTWDKGGHVHYAGSSTCTDTFP